MLAADSPMSSGFATHKKSFWLVLILVMASACSFSRNQRIEFEPQVISLSKEDLELARLNDEELFALGTSAYAAKDFAKASRCFGKLVDLYPHSPHHAKAVINAGLSLNKQERYQEALDRFLMLMDFARGTGDSLDAAFHAAECYYHLKNYPPAIKILSQIASRPDLSVADRLQAQVHHGVCLIENQQPEAAQTALRKAIALWEKEQEEERLDNYFLAQAHFFLGEIDRLYFESVVLDPDSREKTLSEDLEYKCEMLLSSQGHYLRAMRTGDSHWATAAGFRVGELYENLFSAMVNAKAPKELNEEERKIYHEELRKKVLVLVNKAINIYERTLATAQRLGLDSPFVARTKQGFERLKRILLDEPNLHTSSEAKTEAERFDEKKGAL